MPVKVFFSTAAIVPPPLLQGYAHRLTHKLANREKDIHVHCSTLVVLFCGLEVSFLPDMPENGLIPVGDKICAP